MPRQARRLPYPCSDRVEQLDSNVEQQPTALYRQAHFLQKLGVSRVVVQILE